MAVTALRAGNLLVEIDGKAGGFLTSFTPPTYEVEEVMQPLGPGGETKVMTGNPKIGEGVAAFSLVQDGPLFDWVVGTLRKNLVEVNLTVILADQNFVAQRRVDFTGCVITGIEFPSLDAKEAKKPFEVTVTFQPENVKFAKDSGTKTKVGLKAKQWLTSNFAVTIPGIDPKFVTRVELPKMKVKVAQESAGFSRFPTRHYAGFELAGLKTYHAPQGFDAAQEFATKVIQDAVITDDELTTLTADLYDPTMTKVLCTITATGCAPRKFTWSADPKSDAMAASHIEYVVEDLAIERK